MDPFALVLNAGSSSLKFSIFFDHSDELQMVFRAHAEGSFTTPLFCVRDHAGATVAEAEIPVSSTKTSLLGSIRSTFFRNRRRFLWTSGRLRSEACRVFFL